MNLHYVFNRNTRTFPISWLSMVPSFASSLRRSFAYRTEQPTRLATSTGWTLAFSRALAREDKRISSVYMVANLALFFVLFLTYGVKKLDVFKRCAIRHFQRKVYYTISYI